MISVLNRLLLFVTVILFGTYGYSQSGQKVFQLTGVVFGKDSTQVVPGVHVYVPKAGRGTTTNPYGFFSLPVVKGDSVVFSAVGFEKASYVVPDHDKESSIQLIVTLQEDVTYLDELEVFPYPSEEVFKAAVLAVELPNQRDYDNLQRFLSSAVMREAYWNLSASANMNHRFFMQQQQNAIAYRFQPPSNPLLNPFAWNQFIRSLRRNN